MSRRKEEIKKKIELRKNIIKLVADGAGDTCEEIRNHLPEESIGSVRHQLVSLVNCRILTRSVNGRIFRYKIAPSKESQGFATPRMYKSSTEVYKGGFSEPAREGAMDFKKVQSIGSLEQKIKK